MLGDDSDSQLLKLGWAALRRINSQDPAEQPVSIRETMLDTLVSPDCKRPFKLLVSLMFHFTWGREIAAILGGQMWAKLDITQIHVIDLPLC